MWAGPADLGTSRAGDSVVSAQTGEAAVSKADTADWGGEGVGKRW